MNVCHPVLVEMSKLGCSCQKSVFLAFQTYLELCEVEGYQEVGYNFCSELDLIYLMSTHKGKKSFYVPLFAKDGISPCFVDKLELNILTNESDSLYLVLREADSSYVHYKVTKGLIPPLSNEETKETAALQEKKSYFKAELKKMADTFYKSSKSSVE